MSICNLKIFYYLQANWLSTRCWVVKCSLLPSLSSLFFTYALSYSLSSLSSYFLSLYISLHLFLSFKWLIFTHQRLYSGPRSTLKKFFSPVEKFFNDKKCLHIIFRYFILYFVDLLKISSGTHKFFFNFFLLISLTISQFTKHIIKFILLCKVQFIFAYI